VSQVFFVIYLLRLSVKLLFALGEGVLVLRANPKRFAVGIRWHYVRRGFVARIILSTATNSCYH